MKPEHCEALVEGIVDALEAGLAEGGASIDDYRDARGERGLMQDEFLVHTREGQPCPRGDGTIERIVVGGRSTYFCPGCQVRLRKRPRRRKRTKRSAAPHERAAPLPDGFEVGHWSDPVGLTGCTVVLPPEGRAAGSG